MVTIITDNVGHMNRLQIIKEFYLSIPDSMDDFSLNVLGDLFIPEVAHNARIALYSEVRARGHLSLCSPL
jgi:hypothetical protein